MEPGDMVDHAEERARMAAELEDIGLGGEKSDYLVAGRNEVNGVKPGGIVSLGANEAFILLVSGNVQHIENETETPVDEPVADETGHSPEVTESE